MRQFVFLGLLGLAACTDGPPTRLIAGLRDTVVINTARTVFVPVDAVDSAGRVLRSRQLHFQRLSGDTVSVSEDGQVTCARSGDATVRASLGSLSTTFVLYCWPINGLFQTQGYGLFVGGPSSPLNVVGRGLNGERVTMLAARLHVDDTLVASVDHGRVSPRAPGQTLIRVEAGDSQASLYVKVIRRVTTPGELRPYRAFITRVNLAAGEVATWPVAPGRYELRFRADAGVYEQMSLVATSANCARYPDGGAHLSCVARAGASVMLAHPRASGSRGPLSGERMVRQMIDSKIDYWFDVGSASVP